jgi:hypothetical protein
MSFSDMFSYALASLSIYVFKSHESFSPFSSIACSFDFAQKYASDILLI